MSPIDPDTIVIEKWTETIGENPGKIRRQVLAEGDEKDPGRYFQLKRITVRDNREFNPGPGSIVDDYIDPETGKVVTENAFSEPVKGVWLRFLPRIRRER